MQSTNRTFYDGGIIFHSNLGCGEDTVAVARKHPLLSQRLLLRRLKASLGFLRQRSFLDPASPKPLCAVCGLEKIFALQIINGYIPQTLGIWNTICGNTQITLRLEMTRE